MRGAEDRIRKSGGEVVAVGMGTPAQAATFKTEVGLLLRLLVDNERRVYDEIGIKHGSWNEVMGPRNIKSAISAFRSGARQRMPKQDSKQLGGAAVIAPGGEIAWRYISRGSGDNAPVEQIIEQLARASQR